MNVRLVVLWDGRMLCGHIACLLVGRSRWVVLFFQFEQFVNC